MRAGVRGVVGHGEGRHDASWGIQQERHQTRRQGGTVTLLIVLIVLALIFGGIGLLVEGMMWLLIIAGVLFVAGLLSRSFGRGRT